MSRAWLAKGSLIALCLASSVTNLGNRFAQDDMPVIERNGIVHTLAEPWTFFTESYWPKPFAPALYRPLATTGFAVQWQLSGGKPWFFRTVSIAMYLAAGLALFHLAGLLLPPAAAWLAAAFFMVHPVHVEAVAIAVNQSELMVGLLAALVVILYLKFRRDDRFHASHGAALFGLYLAATLFKETGLVIMGLIVAAELTLVDDPQPIRQRLARIRPMLLVMLLGATSFFAIRTFALGGDPVGTFTAEALNGLGIGGRALTMLGVVPQWFRLLLWPARLQADYSPREIETATGFGSEQLTGALLILLTVMLTVFFWRRRPVISFGLLWAAIGIFPVSNVLVPTGIVLAERTLFLPSMGMMLAIGGLAALAIERLAERGRLVRYLAIAGVGAILVMGTTRSASRQRVWQDQFTLWYQTTTDAPLSYRAHHALAELLFKAGARGWAEKEFRTAMYLYPEQWGAYYDLANKLRLADRCDGAVKYYQKTLLIEPGHTAARLSLIACLLDLGEYRNARSEAREGVAYADRPGYVKLFQKFAGVADSALDASAPAGTVRLTIAAADTMP